MAVFRRECTPGGAGGRGQSVSRAIRCREHDRCAEGSAEEEAEENLQPAAEEKGSRESP